MAFSNNGSTLQGYVSVRPFGGVALPVPIQNLVLRNYCQQSGYSYSLPMGEHKYENCFMQLFATINSVSSKTHIGFCSAHMLPRQKDLMEQLQIIVIQKELTIHCLFEGAVINCSTGFQKLRQNLLLRKYADKVDQNVLELKNFLQSKN